LLRSLLIGSLLAAMAAPLLAEDYRTISLATYLRQAEAEGISIIFSNRVVRPRQQVTVTSGNHISLDQVLEVLEAHGLTLKASGDGYAVIPARNDPQLSPAPPSVTTDQPPIEEIIVASSRFRLDMRAAAAGAELHGEEIALRPLTANDPMRAVQQLPGLANDGITAKPRVRGGRDDETLIFFDGVRLYEPFHLKAVSGLLGTIDQRVIDRFEFASGGYSANFGDRLSAVWQIHPRTPADLSGTREAGIGLFTASYLHADHIGDGSFLISLRRSTADAFIGLVDRELGSPSFSDVYARYDRDTANGAQSLSVLLFGDDVGINDATATESATSVYGNAYVWGEWQRQFEQIEHKGRIAFTSIKNDRQGRVDKSGQVIGQLADDQEFRFYDIDQRLAFEFGGRSALSLGLAYRYVEGEYAFDASLNVDPAYERLSNFVRMPSVSIRRDLHGQQLGAFASYRYRFGRRLFLEGGIRLDAQDYLNNRWTQQIDPRINLLYRFRDGWSVRAAWGEFSQAPGVHELQISDGVSQFADPRHAEHVVVGLGKRMSSGIEWRLEAYRKASHGRQWYFDNLTNRVSLVPELQADRFQVRADEFVSQGVELSVSSIGGKRQWWFNYSYASVRDRVAASNQRRTWDQKHSLNAGYAGHLGKWSWTVSGSWHSGWPLTGITFDNVSGQLMGGPRNAGRHGPFFSLDLKTTRSWELSSGQSIRLEGGATNITSRKNELGREYFVDGSTLITKPVYSFKIVPFIDLFWAF
jgi:hypothetical protein